VIQTALTNNLDLRVATARVTEARARYGIVHSFIYPELGVAGGYSSDQNSQLTDPAQASGAGRSYQNWYVGVQASW
jgi:outer membrane protein TolC